MLIASGAVTLGDFCEPADGRTITVKMRANRRDTGMRLNHEDLEWTLRPQVADDFAELAGALAASGRSGHQYLTCGVTDEITVMVSRTVNTRKTCVRSFFRWLSQSPIYIV